VLGSSFEADDAVQETLVRAWRNIDSFEGRSALRSWLYRIATNVCIDMMRRRKPVAGVDPETAEAAGGLLGPAVGGTAPAPAASVAAGPASDAGPGARAGDPAEVAVARDELRHALAAALRLLPPRQRAVLILGDVLRWRAEEVADLLGTSVAAVNSARQRAHATLAAKAPSPDAVTPAATDDPDDALLTRLAHAFHHADVDTLVTLVRPT
jgi:RNA polymerase sigma-70 factor (ECF subfamily)